MNKIDLSKIQAEAKLPNGTVAKLTNFRSAPPRRKVEPTPSISDILAGEARHLHRRTRILEMRIGNLMYLSGFGGLR